MSEYLKKCTKCQMECLKTNFHKKNISDGLTPHCKLCRKIYRKKYFNEL